MRRAPFTTIRQNQNGYSLSERGLVRESLGHDAFWKTLANSSQQGAIDKTQPCCCEPAQCETESCVCKCDRQGESFGKLQSHKAYAQSRDDGAEHETETEHYAKRSSHPTPAGSKNQHVDQTEARAIPEMIGPTDDV